jgi:adenylate cyclase class 2
MQLEVEQKYPVPDHADLQTQLAALGCVFHAPIAQADLYFAHPVRNFKQTDEALRLRRSGDQVFITYKGPKLDPTTKTRREIELPIVGADGYLRYRELLEILGFRPVMEVRKKRTPGELEWENAKLEVALDTVAGLGTFIELEILSPADQLEAAKARLASLATRLGLLQSERRGYLDLLVEKQQNSPQK